MNYSLAKKAVAEIVSTFILVSIGCGAAMGVHADPGVYYLAVALAALLFNWLSKEDVAEDDA